MNKVFVIIFIILLSCEQKIANKKSDSKTNNIEEHYGYELPRKEKIIHEGDKEAYRQLYLVYVQDNILEDFLAYALVMAHKYEYPVAYKDVFDILYSTSNLKEDNSGREGLCYDYDLQCLDEETKKMALYYLKKAIEKGEVSASEILLDYYDKGKHYPIEELYSNKKLIEKAKQNIEKSE